MPQMQEFEARHLWSTFSPQEREQVKQLRARGASGPVAFRQVAMLRSGYDDVSGKTAPTAGEAVGAGALAAANAMSAGLAPKVRAAGSMVESKILGRDEDEALSMAREAADAQELEQEAAAQRNPGATIGGTVAGYALPVAVGGLAGARSVVDKGSALARGAGGVLESAATGGIEGGLSAEGPGQVTERAALGAGIGAGVPLAIEGVRAAPSAVRSADKRYRQFIRKMDAKADRSLNEDLFPLAAAATKVKTKPAKWLFDVIEGPQAPSSMRMFSAGQSPDIEASPMLRKVQHSAPENTVAADDLIVSQEPDIDGQLAALKRQAAAEAETVTTTDPLARAIDKTNAGRRDPPRSSQPARRPVNKTDRLPFRDPPMQPERIDPNAATRVDLDARLEDAIRTVREAKAAEGIMQAPTRRVRAPEAEPTRRMTNTELQEAQMQPGAVIDRPADILPDDAIPQNFHAGTMDPNWKGPPGLEGLAPEGSVARAALAPRMEGGRMQEWWEPGFQTKSGTRNQMRRMQDPEVTKEMGLGAKQFLRAASDPAREIPPSSFVGEPLVKRSAVSLPGQGIDEAGQLAAQAQRPPPPPEALAGFATALQLGVADDTIRMMGKNLGFTDGQINGMLAARARR